MAILIALLCCCLVHVTAAQPTARLTDEAAYAAYLTSDPATAKDLWKDLVARDKADLAKDPDNTGLQYRLALSQFGLLAASTRDRDEELFDQYVDDTKETLEDLLDKDSQWGEARALLSSVYGLILGYSPWKGVFLGPKTSSLMTKAMEDAPESALVWKLYGNSKLFTPQSFGGDLDEAITAFNKAIVLYESSGNTRNNWFYVDTLAFLGQALLKKGQPGPAIAAYEKALRVEPRFTWVKTTLLPSAQKRLAEKGG